MQAILINHNHRYSIEAMSLLFFPGSSFRFVELKNEDEIQNIELEDIYVISKVTRIEQRVIANITLGVWGEITTADNSEEITSLQTDNDKRKSEQNCIKRAFYNAAIKQSCILAPAWGVLTGIRPAKVATALLDEGKSDSQVLDIFSDEYYMKPNKSKLALQVARNESALLQRVKPKVVSLYIAIPFCPSRCSYCSFVSHSIEKAAHLVNDYLEKLCIEIDYTVKLIKSLNLTISTIYIGGGTPTSLNELQLEKLMHKIAECVDFTNVCEYTVEAGRPDTINLEKLKILKKYHVDRISINPQTLNDDVLREIGRRHTTDQTLKAFEMAKDVGFKTINADLIAGLPLETVGGFKSGLNQLLTYDLENITVHTLSIKRASNMQMSGLAQYRSNCDTVEQILDFTYNVLCDKKYTPYYMYKQKNTIGNFENVGYSKAGHEGLYNIYIMEEIHSIFSCGAGGVTKLVGDSHGKIERVFNYKYPYEYINQFDDIIAGKDKVSSFYKYLIN